MSRFQDKEKNKNKSSNVGKIHPISIDMTSPSGS